MRSHLVKYLKNKKMEIFPSTEQRALPPVKREKIHLYCECRMPEGKEHFVQSAVNGITKNVTKYQVSYSKISTANTSVPGVKNHCCSDSS